MGLIETLRRESHTGNEENVEIISALHLEHRTHQANVIRNMIDIVAMYHHEATWDLRNEAAVRVSQDLDELVKGNIPKYKGFGNFYIPYI
jgi:hypothetical protein